MKKMYKDQVLGLLLLAVAVVFGCLTTQIKNSTLQGDPGPKVCPTVACVLLGLCGLVLFVRPEKKEEKAFLSTKEWKRLFTLYGIYLLYWGLLWFAGYRIAIPVILGIIAFLFSRGTETKLYQLLLYTVAVSAVIFILYVVVMETQLPMGILFEEILA